MPYLSSPSFCGLNSTCTICTSVFYSCNRGGLVTLKWRKPEPGLRGRLISERERYSKTIMKFRWEIQVRC